MRIWHSEAVEAAASVLANYRLGRPDRVQKVLAGLRKRNTTDAGENERRELVGALAFEMLAHWEYPLASPVLGLLEHVVQTGPREISRQVH